MKSCSERRPGWLDSEVMLFLGVLIYLAPAAFAVWSILRLFRNRSTSFLYQWQRAFGLLALCTVPWPIVQVARRLSGFGHLSMDVLEGLAVLPGSWYVLFGGQSVVSVFERNVKDWTGHRRDTMLDNAPVFFGMLLVQVLILSLLVAWRFKQEKRVRDPLVIAVALFATINAALAMSWEWFGT